MLTYYGMPFLRRLHCIVATFERYLCRWRELLEGTCPCGDCG